jgi:hypothetical protein
MKNGSRQIIHAGIHFVFAPPPVINKQLFLQFQQALIAHSLDITNTVYRDDVLTVVREQPVQLQIMVVAPPKQPTGELLIISTGGSLHLESFIQETEFIIESFIDTWQQPNRQIISQDATIRDLYETEADHAFQEIWETRLNQPGDSLAVLGGLVLGGGLRFVIPPQANNLAQIEVKIESFLRDTHKIFFETQFVWQQPMVPSTLFAPREKIEQVNDYATDKVVKFMSGEK